MIFKGYKKPLTPNDMWDLIPENETKTVVNEFDKIWVPEMQRKRAEALKKMSTEDAITDLNIAFSIWKMFWPTFIFISSIRLVASVLTFANPLVLDLLIAYMTPDSNEPQWRGYFYASLMFVSPLFESLLNGQFEYLNSIMIMKIRACIITTIYKKVI